MLSTCKNENLYHYFNRGYFMLSSYLSCASNNYSKRVGNEYFPLKRQCLGKESKCININNYFNFRTCLSLHPSTHLCVSKNWPLFLQSDYNMSVTKVTQYVFRVKNMHSWLPSDPQGAFTFYVDRGEEGREGFSKCLRRYISFTK